MAARILPFVSRQQQLARRGAKRFGRFMALTKGFVEANSAKHLAWRAEELAERETDAGWCDRHGRIEGGARILEFDQNLASGDWLEGGEELLK